MQDRKKINKLINEIEKISEIEKCLTCQCFYDTLLEFKDVIGKAEGNRELEERLLKTIEKSKVSHNCLGCDPCYPVPLSNALSEMMGSPISTCGPICKAAPMKLMTLTPSWPVEQGEYIVGKETSPVAINTLGSDELPEVISKELGIDNFAIVGKTHTENIGIEKVIKNTISNPHIRFLILCGKDTKGHRSGQSMLALFENGVNHERRIINSKGKRPFLKNLELLEIEHFRSQVEITDLIGCEDIRRIEEGVDACKAESPGRFDKTVAMKRVTQIEAQRPKKLILDPSGFFIIYPKKEEGRIYLEHYKKDGTLNEIIYGEDPVSIASTTLERGLVSRLDHAAYLGRELEKAYLSMIYGFQYIQDRAP